MRHDEETAITRRRFVVGATSSVAGLVLAFHVPERVVRPVNTPMEPLNITVRFDGDRAEAWTTSQLPTLERAAMAQVLGLQPEQVTFHIGFAGGAFGRRGTLDSHLEREVAAIVSALQK